MPDIINKPPEIPGGFVLIARGIAKSSLMTTPSNAFKVSIWMLAKARYEDYKWFDSIRKKDIVIKRGELTFNYDDIVETTNLTYSQVRTAVEHLLGHGFIQDLTPKEVKVAHGYMHFRIVKFEHYQLMNNYYSNQIAQGSHTHLSGSDNDSHLLKETKEGISNKDICNRIFTHWNAMMGKVIEHRKLTDKMIRVINARLSEGHTEEEIKSAITNYSKILSDKVTYYFNYVWTLELFLKRPNGFPQFMSWEIAHNNCKRGGAINKPKATEQGTFSRGGNYFKK